MITMNNSGDVVNRLRRYNFDPRSMRNVNRDGVAYAWNGANSVPIAQGTSEQARNDGLPVDSWKMLDSVITKEIRTPLVAFQDAVSCGTIGLGDSGVALGTLEYVNSMIDESGSVSMSMSGRGTGHNDTPDMKYEKLPLPIIYSDFEVEARYQNAAMRGVYGSGKLAFSIDTYMLEQIARRIGEKLEDLTLIGGGTFAYGTDKIYGYTTAPYRVKKVLTKSWTDSSMTYALVEADVRDWLEALTLLGFTGNNFVMYIPKEWESVLSQFTFPTYTDATWRSSLLKQFPQLKDIKVSYRLPADQPVIVNLTGETVKVVNGFAPTIITWKSEDQLATSFKVMAMQIPKIYSTYGGKCGVLHAKLTSNT
jgi:hypothetical protein